MKLIVCVDLNNGMLFNNRRQSKDNNLIMHISNMIGDKKLWITEFSKNLYKEKINYNLLKLDDVSKISEDEFCFIENISPSVLEKNVEEIIIYNWNRNYPADFYFDINLDNWILKSQIDIIGSSHSKITQKIYKRGEKNEK